MSEDLAGIFTRERHSPEWRDEGRQSGDWRSQEYLFLSEAKDQADRALQVVLVEA